ncbi:MAG: DUF1521 domain-containing protein [Candidatus Caenarcaniphilales bacterium]|nr:DUF1521 domain-containing protein [Candidatus Caenarcaniphilales bacterium]
MAINPSINRSVETVSSPNTAASAVNNPQAADDASLLNAGQRIGDLASGLTNPAPDGDNNFKDTYLALARADMEVSETEMVIYDGMYSNYQSKLHGVRSQIAGLEGEIAQKATQISQESAKTEIKTEINNNGNAVFTTHGGFTIETDTNKGGHQTWIRNAEGETMAHIWGDPHVDLNADGVDDFHFGDNSSFMLEDGSEVFLNTQNVAGTDAAGGYTHSKVFFTTGVYVKAGDNIVQTGDDTKDDGNRETGFRTGVAASEMNIGKDEDGAAVFGLDSSGAAHIQDSDGTWNQLEDESWDGYLNNASFNDQHGADSNFSPEAIMSNSQIADIQADKDAMEQAVVALQGEEETLVANTLQYDFLRKEAEESYDSAVSDYERYEAMDDSGFEDNDETRFNAEQKSLELVNRTANIGEYLHANTELVDDETKTILDDSSSVYSSIEQGALSEMEQDQTDFNRGEYRNEGLMDTHDNLDTVMSMLTSINLVVEASDFEEASIEYDNLQAAGNDQFSQGIADFNGAVDNSMTAINEMDSNGFSDAINGANEILNNLELHAETGGVSIDYQDLQRVYDIDFENPPADSDLGNAGIFLTQAQTQSDLNINIALKDDLNNQFNEFIELDTDLARASADDVNLQIGMTDNLIDFNQSSSDTINGIIDNITVDFGDISSEDAFQLYEVHKADQVDFLDQKTQFEALDTDLARASAEDMNLYISVNDKVISELEKQYGFSPDQLTDS